jgi:hypothetical protein
MGVRSDATDGYDAGLEPLTTSTDGGYAGVYHESDPPEWTGVSGYYRHDYRGPLFPTEAMTWEPLHTWAQPSYLGETMYVTFLAHPNYLPPADREYMLELLYVPESVTGAPAVGTTWDLVPDGGESFTLELPTYRAADGHGAYQLAFTIGPANMPGDMDDDGDVDFDDIPFFVLGLSDPVTYEDEFGFPASSTGDMDTDGDLDFDDIAGFVAVLGGGGALQVVPEPTAAALAAMALIGLALCGSQRGVARRLT